MCVLLLLLFMCVYLLYLQNYLCYDLLSLTHIAVVLNEASTRINNDGRQPLFPKVQIFLQGLSCLPLYFCFLYGVNALNGGLIGRKLLS